MKKQEISVLQRFVKSSALSRRLVKTLSWRLVGSGSTFIIAYVVTGQAVISSGIAIAQMIANTILYYIHELAWDRLP
jgi:uncharacterized membrane protein